MLLARYDFELIDKHGNSVKKVPEPDRNNMCVVAAFAFINGELIRPQDPNGPARRENL
jgi:hypothetical protein